MLQELALAAAAWSAAALDNAWFALEAYCFVEEHVVTDRRSLEDESIPVGDLMPGQRIAVRVADREGRPQYLMGCVEEVVDERIVLSRSVSHDVEVLFHSPSWSEGLPYIGEHWGTYWTRHTLEYQGVSVVPVAAVRRIDEDGFPDWITLGEMPQKLGIGGPPNAWYLDR
jgi:hypothetical protein